MSIRDGVIVEKIQRKLEKVLVLSNICLYFEKWIPRTIFGKTFERNFKELE